MKFELETGIFNVIGFFFTDIDGCCKAANFHTSIFFSKKDFIHFASDQLKLSFTEIFHLTKIIIARKFQICDHKLQQICKSVAKEFCSSFKYVIK